MIGVKVDKNNTSNKTVQKKANGTAEAKSKSAPAVAQLCGCGDKNKKSEEEESTSKSSFWSPETIQGKFEGGIKQLKSAPSFPPIQLNDSNSNPAESVSTLENKTGLPDDVKTNTEKLSGVSLNDVKVHYNSSAPAQLHAHAYAQGTDIHVGPGQEKHVPHEAWHVVQQKQGRVKATTQMKGMVPVNDDAGLEKEADVMGAKAVQMVSMEEEAPVQQKAIGNNGGVAQLGMLSWIKNSFGYGSKKEDDTKTRPRSNAVTEMPEMDDVTTRPRSNAVTEDKRSWFNKAASWIGAKKDAAGAWMGEQKDGLVKGAGKAYNWMGEQKDGLVKGAGKAYNWMGEQKDAAKAWLGDKVGHNNEVYTKTTKKEAFKFASLIGSGGISAGVGVAKHYAEDALKLGGSLGVGLSSAGGVIGALGGALGFYSNAKEYRSNGVDKNTKIKAGGNAIASLAGGVSSFGSLMGNVSGKANEALNNPTTSAIKDAANNAAQVSGILGIITGSIDMVKGALEFRIAGKRKKSSDDTLIKVLGAIVKYNHDLGIPSPKKSVEEIVKDGDYNFIHDIVSKYIDNAPEGDKDKANEYKDILLLAGHLSKKQSNYRISAASTIGKGAMAIAGGAVLVALGSNPVGWGLLGAAAVVGIGILINDYIKKKKNREQIALREFNIVKEQQDYVNKYSLTSMKGIGNRIERKKDSIVDGAKRFGAWISGKEVPPKKEDEKSPLELKLIELGKKDVGHWYADYVKVTAGKILNDHYGRDNDTTYIDILKNLGFKTKSEIDEENKGKETKPPYPDEKQIAKAINS